MIELLKMLLRRFEGIRLRPYLCPAGVPTIAGGATRYEDGTPVKLSDPPITLERAEELLDHDARVYAQGALTLSPNLAPHAEKHAAVSDFCYNLGTTRYKSSTLRRRIAAEDWEGAAAEAEKWVWGGGKKLPGLVRRRAVMANLLTLRD